MTAGEKKGGEGRRCKQAKEQMRERKGGRNKKKKKRKNEMK